MEQADCLKTCQSHKPKTFPSKELTGLFKTRLISCKIFSVDTIEEWL